MQTESHDIVAGRTLRVYSRSSGTADRDRVRMTSCPMIVVFTLFASSASNFLRMHPSIYCFLGFIEYYYFCVILLLFPFFLLSYYSMGCWSDTNK